MSTTHFFQRYSQEENLVTNNTLRLFTQLYRDSPSRLEDLLEGLIDGVSIDVGVGLQQQTPGQSSIPDGSLTQSSFRVVLETKMGDSFSTDQLERHLDAFGGEDQRILLLLSPHQPEEGELDQVRETIEEKDQGVTFAAVEFADVINVLIGEGEDGEDPLVSEYEQDLYEMVIDYQNFCSDQDLLPADDLMYAVPCGDTHKLNFAFDLYYHPSSRGYRNPQYVGLYRKKAIRGIGKLEHAVHADLVEGDLEGEGVEKLSDDEEERILGAMEMAPEVAGHSVERDHEFLLVDKYYETEFRKVSDYGMRGPQYFDLRDYLEVGEGETLPAPELIAQELAGEDWT